MGRFPLAAPVAALAVLALAATLIGCNPESKQRPPAARGGPVYFVPVGEPEPPFLDELARHYAEKLGLRVEVLAPVPIEDIAVDRNRDQLILEELITLIRRRYPTEAADRTAVMVGVTVYDAYIRSYTQWQWAFSLREESQFAVGSIARMDEQNFGHGRNDEVLKTRLRKMITKNLGIMYYGLEQSKDRRSVMFGPILGVDDLDSVGEEF